MTDEERRKLCADLRAIGPLIGKGAVWVVTDCAADEIERLARIVCEARKLLGENFENE
jgi:hypothetical protein